MAARNRAAKAQHQRLIHAVSGGRFAVPVIRPILQTLAAGLDPDAVRERYADYIERFSVKCRAA